jgi:hypothetical protein
MSNGKVLALLGRRDEPSDAVEDYCQNLASALRGHGLRMELDRVPWAENGWSDALLGLRQKSSFWQNKWVFLQYTALAWSARGFPLRFLRVVHVLRQAGARIGIVYHDVEPYSGKRLVDKIRRLVQLYTMRKTLGLAQLAVFTVPVENLSWIDAHQANAIFIPVGANLTSPEKAWNAEKSNVGRPPTIAIYGITGGKAGISEIASVWDAVEYVAKRLGRVRLLVFGRNSEFCEEKFKRLSEALPVEVQVLGFLPVEEVVQRLASSDVLLFVRGEISSRRGSAIAGIACGLPIVALEGSETAAPITEAGVVLLPANSHNDELGKALLRILTDGEYRSSLAKRSREAQQRYFSWQAIASRYAQALHVRT